MNETEYNIDTWMLKQYSLEFKKRDEQYVKENTTQVDLVLKKMKEQEAKINKWNNDELMNIMVYIYRDIFWKQIKSWLALKIREINTLLSDILFVLEKNKNKINKYITQWTNAEFKVNILWKEYKGNSLDLEEKNIRAIYYVYYLFNELEVINSITDWLDQIIDFTFDNDLFYTKIEDVLHKIAYFIILLETETETETETNDTETDITKTNFKKITLSNTIKQIYLITNQKMKEFITSYNKVKSFDLDMKSITDYMNRYIKFKDVLELYYNKLYNQVIEVDMSFQFYINNKQ